MRERVCGNCGGREYKVVGQNMVKCLFCGTLYVDEHASKEEEVLLVGARELVRDFKFDEAVKEFEKILALYPLSFDAYYGKALAKNKVVEFVNKKRTAKRPCFYGDMVSLVDDEDFKKAVELAPAEVAKNFNQIAKMTEKVKKNYDNSFKDKNYDIFICNIDGNEKANELYANLKDKFSVYCPEVNKLLEEEVYAVLQTCKVLLVFGSQLNELSVYNNIFDRYHFLILKKRKTLKSFVIVLKDLSKQKELPQSLSFCKSVVDSSSVSFVQDIEAFCQQQVENAVGLTAKIEPVRLEKAIPAKKEYTNLESVTPVDLGHYNVATVSANAETKTKWIFLTIKNGDFASAQELIEKNLQEDPYNSELLFAKLMAQLQIKTREEFFEKLSNFKDQETIELILRYASKEFAENFVDDWEKLIEKLDEKEYYNQYLTYLASYNTPNRTHFIEQAKTKAIESLDDTLIENVLKCFGQNEVDKLIEFYFLLAQKSDKQDYYQKILQLDEGHFQSNMTLFLQHFKSQEEKLTYRNRQEFEEIFKYFDDNSRILFVSAIVEIVLPVAFVDLKEAEAQLDFYLSYVMDNDKAVQLLTNIAEKFQAMGMFKQAEKYLALAISKDGKRGDLFWKLILIKAHCKTESELILSDVKVMQMPEWETLLEVADDNQKEYYASIISKGNLYKGKKKPFANEVIGKTAFKDKLNAFLLRNKEVLLEVEKENGVSVQRGVEYYKFQLQPFEKYLKQLEEINTFEEYCQLLAKVEERLEGLNLNLDASVSVVNLQEKSGGMQNVYQKHSEKLSSVEQEEKQAQQLEQRKRFWKVFLCGFLEFFPLLFAAMLLTISIFIPKEVYLYFSQDFLIGCVAFAGFVALVNLTMFIIMKNKVSKRWKSSFLALCCLGFMNVFLFLGSFYLVPTPISILSAQELKVLLPNAKYADFVLENDIDLGQNIWKSTNFSGTLDGKGHKISNISLLGGGFFATNNGHIKNLEFNFAESLIKASNFGSVASCNRGEIENCIVTGELSLELSSNAIVGGFVGKNTGGKIVDCESLLTITLNVQAKNIELGGFVGRAEGGEISKNSNRTQLIASFEVDKLQLGGMIGNLRKNVSKFECNANELNLRLSGNAKEALVGGLVGQGEAKSENSFVTGSIDARNLSGQGFVGGLYGAYENINLKEEISHSYSALEIQTNFAKAALIGRLGGRVNSCFAIGDRLVAELIFSQASTNNCHLLDKGTFYVPAVNFDSEIWNISTFSYPTLK